MPSRLARSTSLLALSCLAGCGAEEAEVVLRVSPGAGVEEVDALNVHARAEGTPGALAEVRVDVSEPLPRAVLVRPGNETAGATVRIHVDALLGDRVIAAGDVRVELPTSGRQEAAVTVERACSGVSCPFAQGCDPERGACDSSCLTPVGCEELLGCDVETTCTEAGVCVGGGADEDGDGHADGRCTLQPVFAANDCDDTDPEAHPGGARACGSLRDHDCNGRVDELDLCASACSPGTTTLGAASTYEVDLGSNVVSMALRETSSSMRIFATDGESISSFDVDLASMSVTSLDVVEARGARQLALAGPLLGATTSRGLLLVAVAADGTLSPTGPPIAVRAGADASLDAIAMAESTVWVSGDGVGVAAVDVTHPDAPRVLGLSDGPSAIALARVDGGVVAATRAPDDVLRYYPAPAGREPSAARSLDAELGLDGVTATALFAAPGRAAAGEPEMLAVAIAASDASVLLVQRSGADAFARGGEIGGLLPVVGVHLDEGVVSWAAANGAAGAALRGAGPGEVATVQAALPAGAAPETSAFAATTTPDGSPVIATAHGRTVRIVELACE